MAGLFNFDAGSGLLPLMPGRFADMWSPVEEALRSGQFDPQGQNAGGMFNPQGMPQTAMAFAPQGGPQGGQPPALPPPANVASLPQPPQPQPMPQMPPQGQQDYQPPPKPTGLGGFMGALQGFINPEAPFQLRQQQQNQQLTYRAARDAGVPHAQALLLATNPQAAQAITPKLTESGTDPLTGQKQFFWANPFSQTTSPLSGNNAASAGGPNSFEAFQKAGEAGVSGEALYDHMPKNAQDIVRQIVEGRMPALSLRSPAMIPYLKMAASVDPTLDMTNPAARQAALTDARTGKVAQGQKALNQFLHHMTTQLIPAFENLDNSGIPAWNALANWAHTQSGGSKVTGFLPVAHAVSEEISKIFKQNNLSDHEIKQWEASLNPNMSPEQQREAAKALLGLATGGMEALHDQRLRGVGPIMDAKLGPMIDEKAQKELDSVKGWIAGGKLGIAPPSPAAASPAQPAAPIKEGATATNPRTGQKAIFKGGKWIQQ